MPTPQNPTERSPDVVQWSEVRSQEHEDIRQRRAAAHFAEPPENAGTGLRDLVGLALSGGGVRSASFNLGVLQAFYQCGFLRFVDYLTTVSGGGYIGSYFSARVSRMTDQEQLYRRTPSSGPADPAVAVGDLKLEPQGHGRQPLAVLRLLRGGKYLSHPLSFLNRYLVGLVLNNIALFSLVLALCALIALAWRGLDTFAARQWWSARLENMGDELGNLLGEGHLGLALLGQLSQDLYVAFLPAGVALALWVLVWSISLSLRGRSQTSTLILGLGLYFGLVILLLLARAPRLSLLVSGIVAVWMTAWVMNRRNSARATGLARRAAQVLLFLAVASLLIGGTVLLGNGNIMAGGAQPWILPNELLTTVTVVFLICLVPLIRPWRLVGSGQKPRSPFDTYVFRAASAALLVGVPLLGVYIFARENVSGYGTYSIDQVTDWKRFAETVRAEAKADRWPAVPIWEELNKPFYDVGYMRDIQELREVRPAKDQAISSPAETFTLRDLLELPKMAGDVSPVFGVLPDTQYPHVLNRRRLLIRALNRVMDREDLVEKTLNASHRGSRENLRRMLTSVYAVSTWLAAAAELAPLQLDQWPDGIDPPLVAAVRVNTAGFPRMERLLDLLEKYYYLLERKNKGELERLQEFKREWEKPDFKRELNQLLLAVYYPTFLPAQKAIVRRVVVADRDQQVRWHWFLGALAVFVLAAVAVNVNATSMHGFYRDQLVQTYIRAEPGCRDKDDPPLAKLAGNTARGAPYHLLAASLALYPSVAKLLFGGDAFTGVATTDETQLDEEERREGNPTDGFLFAPRYCGAESTAYRRTEHYLVDGEPVKLADAMAISGAAVSPLRVPNPLMRAIMVILNLRLGQWLPHPNNGFAAPGAASKSQPEAVSRFTRTLRALGRDARQLARQLWDRPSILNLLWFNLVQRPADRRFCFVTDGGHHENLGLWPLLQRRCHLILVSDASQDNRHTFEDFLRLLRRARLDEGIDLVELESDDVHFRLHPLRLYPDGPTTDAPYLKSLAERFSQKHYVVARIKYPTGEPGYLVYLKASLTGDEENDLVGFCRENADFPHDPTSNPIFNEDQVESYRQLGYHIARGLCREIGAAAPSSGDVRGPEFHFWSCRDFTIQQLVSQWIDSQRREKVNDEEVSRLLREPAAHEGGRGAVAAIRGLQAQVRGLANESQALVETIFNWHNDSLPTLEKMVEQLKALTERLPAPHVRKHGKAAAPGPHENLNQEASRRNGEEKGD